MNRTESGFTLLEVLASLVVVGLLMAALGGGFRLGLTATSAQDRLTARNEDLVVIDRIFRKVIGNATAGSSFVDTPFVGAAHEVSFTTLLSGPFGQVSGGLSDISIGIDRRHRLVLTWSPHHAVSIGGAPAGVIEVLAEAIDRVDIDYEAPLVAGAPRGTTLWRSSWTEAGLPALVRIHLVAMGKTEKALPDIVAVTRLRDRTL